MPSNSTGFWVASTTNGPRQLVGVHVDGDAALLHALEQARLGLGRGAVDLVDEHDVGEDRPGPELEAVLALVEHVGPHDVGGQQVGGALHPRELQVEHARDRPRERRLAHAREVLDEHVALGGDAHDHVVQQLRADLDRSGDPGLQAPDECDRRLHLVLAEAVGSLQALH